MVIVAFLIAMFGSVVVITRRPLSAGIIFAIAISLTVAGHLDIQLSGGPAMIESLARDITIMAAIFAAGFLWVLNDDRLEGRNLFST